MSNGYFRQKQGGYNGCCDEEGGLRGAAETCEVGDAT